MTLRHYVCSTRRKSRRCPGNPFSCLACWPGDWLSWSNCTDGKPTFHRHANLSWFSKICNLKSEIVDSDQAKLEGFLEKRPLMGKFSKHYSERTQEPHRTRSCVQISWNTADRKSAKSCVVYLIKKNFRKGSRFCTDRAQNLPGPAPNNILGVPQISSKSIDFRRSYSQTYEHRWNAPQSISNTRRSFSFFAE